MIERKFKNELGNDIQILIREIVYDNPESAIEIDIHGPGTSMEEILTKEEVSQLYMALKEFYGDV